MTSSKENLMPNFASTFQPLINQKGYLVNQDDLSCREVFGKALAILRTSQDHEKSLSLARIQLILTSIGVIEPSVS